MLSSVMAFLSATLVLHLILLLPLSSVHGQNVVVEFFDTEPLEVKEGDHFNVRIAKLGIVDRPVLVVVTVSICCVVYGDIDGKDYLTVSVFVEVTESICCVVQADIGGKYYWIVLC
ncbi:hypothetical protein PoB_003176300 [Plakobranchus ocellatus]|uniref:Uncharacterized protein n=1 Tax=Plakobranchus ocellatus TaxID=259542 RepID=A0AAV4ADC2_9GAST|nr:hypothetical protein PoB_003176300 [Plakobranchus ocellatus]